MYEQTKKNDATISGTAGMPTKPSKQTKKKNWCLRSQPVVATITITKGRGLGLLQNEISPINQSD